MRRAIEDEFTHLNISRQRKYQLRKSRDQQCTECGEPVIAGSRCLKHLVEARERQRQRRGLKRRYKNTLSYKLEEKTGPRRSRAAGPGAPQRLPTGPS